MQSTPTAREASRDAVPTVRRPWQAPALQALPPLEELTLQSAISGDIRGFSFLDVSDPSRRLL